MKTRSDRVTWPTMKTWIGRSSMGGDRPRDVLPIELLNSFDLLANARVEYVDAIVDYNQAQFAMYVALGQPPANTLAHPVPVEGVVPRDVPPPQRSPGMGPAPPTVLGPPIPRTQPLNQEWRQPIPREFRRRELLARRFRPHAAFRMSQVPL